MRSHYMCDFIVETFMGASLLTCQRICSLNEPVSIEFYDQRFHNVESYLDELSTTLNLIKVSASINETSDVEEKIPLLFFS